MLRVFTAFSGYDSQCLALNVLVQEVHSRYKQLPNGLVGLDIFDYDLVGWSEIDKYAIKAHNALFPQWADRNYGDISKIDWSQVPDFDLFTYSSPCQDFSQAGKQAGAEKGSGTRSSLLWECERAIEAKRPKYLLFENVAAVASKKFVRLFNEWQLTLERLGYTNFTQVLNAKTHGYPTPVPQNRERLFMVSIHNCKLGFYFPDPKELTTRLKDVLEESVGEKYYLSQERINGMIASTEREREREREDLLSCQNLERILQIRSQQKMDQEKLEIILGWTRDHQKGLVRNWHFVDVFNSITATNRPNTQNYILEI